jgi:hypothetical protein
MSDPKRQNPCPKCGTYLWDDPRPCWSCARTAAAPSEELHRDCHDLVCNGSRRHPRGAQGVGCSCRGREARAAAAPSEVEKALSRVLTCCCSVPIRPCEHCLKDANVIRAALSRTLPAEPPKGLKGHIDSDCEFVRGVGWMCTCETPEAKAARAKELAEIEAEQDAAALPVEDEIDRLIQEVAELPDRTSPDDWPEAMLVTADELRTILRAALSRRASGAQETGK